MPNPFGKRREVELSKIKFVNQGVSQDANGDLLKLKGVGEYTAAAIASFSYNEAVPVVDGNVFRVLSRYFDIDTDIAQASAKKEFAALAFELMPKDTRGGAELSEANPAIFNQAIMEFGALQCKPVSPNCSACPVLTTCSAHRENQVALLPIKLKKVKVRKRFFVYHLQQNAQKQLAFQKRGPKDIWEGLFEFPLTEFADENQFKTYLADQNIIGGRFQHVLTHQRIEAYFVRAPHLDQKTSDLIFLDLAGLQDHPIPRLIDKFLIAHSDELF